jgi:hypothetical protein
MNLFSLMYILNEDIKSDSDLKGLYDKFNRLYFDGRLPSIPVIFKSLKNVGGQVIYRINNLTKVVTVEQVQISSFMDRTDDHLEAILLHEMVHVDMLTQNIKNTFRDRTGHGPEFKFKIKEIEQKSGIKVPLEDILSGKVSSSIKTRFFQLMLRYHTDTYFLMVVLKDGLISIGEFRKYCETMGVSDAYLVRSNDRELLKYPAKTVFRDLKAYRIDRDVFDRIIKSGKILDVVHK